MKFFKTIFVFAIICLTYLLTSYAFGDETVQPVPRKLVELTDTHDDLYAPKRDKIVLSKSSTLVLNGPVTGPSIADLSDAALQMSNKLPAGQPIYLVLNSPGGEVQTGSEFIQLMRNIGRPVHTITLFGASMAFQIAEQLGTRYVVEDGTLMSHRIKGGVEGEFPGQVVNRMNYTLQWSGNMDERIAKRAGITVEKYQEMINDEYWCAGKGCLADNFADKIADVGCDNSMTGHHTVHLNPMEAIMGGQFMLGGPPDITVTYSDCPLITSPLSTSASGLGTHPTIRREFKTINQLIDYVRVNSNSKDRDDIVHSLMIERDKNKFNNK